MLFIGTLRFSIFMLSVPPIDTLCDTTRLTRSYTWCLISLVTWPFTTIRTTAVNNATRRRPRRVALEHANVSPPARDVRNCQVVCEQQDRAVNVESEGGMVGLP